MRTRERARRAAETADQRQERLTKQREIGLGTLPRLPMYKFVYRIALNFSGFLISRISRIFNCLRKHFKGNFWHAACSVHIQRIRKIISTKTSKIAIRENLDPPKFSAIRYKYTIQLACAHAMIYPGSLICDICVCTYQRYAPPCIPWADVGERRKICH